MRQSTLSRRRRSSWNGTVSGQVGLSNYLAFMRPFMHFPLCGGLTAANSCHMWGRSLDVTATPRPPESPTRSPEWRRAPRPPEVRGSSSSPALWGLRISPPTSASSQDLLRPPGRARPPSGSSPSANRRTPRSTQTHGTPTGDRRGRPPRLQALARLAARLPATSKSRITHLLAQRRWRRAPCQPRRRPRCRPGLGPPLSRSRPPARSPDRAARAALRYLRLLGPRAA